MRLTESAPPLSSEAREAFRAWRRGWDPRPFPAPDPDVLADLDAGFMALPGRPSVSDTKTWMIRRDVARLTGADTRTWTPVQASTWMEFLGGTTGDLIQLHLMVSMRLETVLHPSARTAALG